MAEGDILFFVDSDVAIPSGALSQVSSAFSCDTNLTAIIGSYDDEPRASNFLSQFKNLHHHYVHQRSSEQASTFWGACGAIRKKTFVSLGGFEESYKKPSIEDIELGYRLKKEGRSIRLIKSLQVKHLKRWGLFSLLKSDIFQRAIPWTKLIFHTRLFINDLNVKTSDRISVILTFGLLGNLIGLLIWPWLVPLAVALAISLFLLNADLYRFFRLKRGLLFAIQSVTWHWFYLFYCGFAFSLGTVGYLLGYCFLQEKTSHRKA
jgi:GT2 family glycosyltransferase